VLNRREDKAERCEDGDHAELAKRVELPARAALS
jgi:hypothetical protein